MAMKHWAWVILVAAACSGCELLTITARNLVVLPAQCIDDCRSRKLNERLAEAAWLEIEAGHPGVYSKHYARGFRRGYADYLYIGGEGQPPPVPPWYYQTLVYQTPRGYQAILEWYDGFRHGAATAMASSQRRWIIVPLSRPVVENTVSQASPPAPAEPDLPPPQKLMPPPQKRMPPAEPEVIQPAMHQRIFGGKP
jgi:hypothetical protein